MDGKNARICQMLDSHLTGRDSMQRTEPRDKRKRDYIAPQVPSIPMLVGAGAIREVRKMALKTDDVALDFPVVMLRRP
jgi:hypothetical protein